METARETPTTAGWARKKKIRTGRRDLQRQGPLPITDGVILLARLPKTRLAASILTANQLDQSFATI